jgi:hypothetical protein
MALRLLIYFWKKILGNERNNSNLGYSHEELEGKVVPVRVTKTDGGVEVWIHPFKPRH